MTLPEDEALRLWEAMFGNAASAKGGNYTCDYKRFMELIKAYGDSCKVDVLDTILESDSLQLPSSQYARAVIEACLADLQPLSPEKRAE